MGHAVLLTHIRQATFTNSILATHSRDAQTLRTCLQQFIYTGKHIVKMNPSKWVTNKDSIPIDTFSKPLKKKSKH